MAFKFGIEQDGVLSAVPAPVQMFLFSQGITIFTAVALAAELGIADLLDSPRSIDEMAQATSAHPGSLYRLLRLLSTFGIFSEVEPRRFAQTPLSELLKSAAPGSLRPWVRMIHLPVWPPLWAEAMHSVKTGEDSFKRTMGVEFFDYLTAHPREGEIFNEAMTAFGQGVAAAVVQTYDFGGVRTIVDVGGGHGTLISVVLQANPHLTGILFDQPHVAEGARRALTATGVADRCGVVGGDFFVDSLPAGCDAYMLSWIIHDWGAIGRWRS